VPLLLGAAILTAVLTTAPWPTLLFIGLCYLGAIPFSIRSYRHLKRTAEALRAAQAAAARSEPAVLRAVDPPKGAAG
jgi:CDP-diacylglycerol---serine O-phosphatidyltransferase